MPSWFHPRASTEPYFCVVGSPVAHSKSPLIHQAFAAQFGRALTYERVEVQLGSLAAALAEFRSCGGIGMNVTVPLKSEAWALAGKCTPRASAARAANTLWFDDGGGVAADNTDGVGLVRDLENNHGLRLQGATVLLLGAGGAARGVVPALLEASPGLLQISNRTPSKAAAIAAAFAPTATLEVVPWGAGGSTRPDLIINATSLSLRGELPPLAPGMLGPESVCYDMMYSAEPTVFVAWAKTQGVARAIDGLGMLVEQAAEAFNIWHGQRPATAAVIAELRAR